MRRYCFFLFVLGFPLGNLIYAQEWSKRDSVWLEEVLAGKEKIRLNPEFQKRIESGTLLQPSSIKSEIKLSTPELFPIEGSSDFLPNRREKALNELPTFVFRLYDFKQADSIMTPLAIAFMIPKGVVEKSTAVVTFDTNHLLSMVFLPSYRAIHRNKKRAVAYKAYDQPFKHDSTSTKKLDERALNDYVNRLREQKIKK